MKEEFGKLKNDNNNLSNKVEALNSKNNEFAKKIGDLENEIKNLKIKVDFMEPIVLSLISRKIINYSVIKILQNYKKKDKSNSFTSK